MNAECQCGAIKFTTPTPAPLALYICHCDDCRRQASSAFGSSAIFPRFALPETDQLSCYTRPTSTGQTLYCYFCRNCGTRLIHTTPPKNVVSVKAGCLQGLDWTKATHIWTKSAMVPIPEGSETHGGPPPSKYSSSYSGSSSFVSSLSSSAGSSESLDQPGELMGSGSCHINCG